MTIKMGSLCLDSEARPKVTRLIGWVFTPGFGFSLRRS